MADTKLPSANSNLSSVATPVNTGSVATTAHTKAASTVAAPAIIGAAPVPQVPGFNVAIPYKELKGRHVVVGLSGGVDSSLSAALLKEAGMKVTALFMKNWEEDDNGGFCAASIDRNDAEAVCQTLDIPFKTINFAAEYWDNVFENFLSEYKAGRTPNPDILCNKEIKFKAFLDYALSDLDADFIATGHYCLRSFPQVGSLGSGASSISGGTGRLGLADNNEPTQLLRGLDPNKDQSYFLHAIGPHKLDRVLFPVGHLLKSEVRAMASARGLPTAKKKDSTGICFIGEKHFNEFLHQYLPEASRPGPIISVEGEVLGEHPGLMYCTIGQRKGLHIGGQADGTGEAWYVVAKDIPHNALIDTFSACELLLSN